MMFAGLLFAFQQAGVRAAADAGVHPFEIAFFRAAFGLLVVAPWILRHGLIVLRSQRLGLHVLRTAIDTASMMAWFVALSLAPMAQVNAIGFTGPIFATVLAALVLGETVRLRRWTAIVAGFVGALIVVRPGIVEVGLGPMLALASAVATGAVVLILRFVGRTDSSVTTTTLFTVIATPIALVPALFFWTWPALPTLAVLCGVGVTGNLGQIAFVQALRVGETGVVMPFDYVKLFWIAGLGFALFDQVPSAYTWAGAAIIFGAGAYIAYRERAIKHAARKTSASA